MGLRFNSRVSIIPGLRVNLSKSGAGLSIGHRGVSYTIGPKGRQLSVIDRGDRVPDESYSDVTIRRAAVEHESLNAS